MPTGAVPPNQEFTRPRVDALTGVSEPILVAGLRQGDPECMSTLFRAYFSVLVAFVRRYVNSVDEAEELVAAFFARLWEHRASWAPRHTIESYLFAAVRNAALNAARTTRREARRNLAALANDSFGIAGTIIPATLDDEDEESAAASMRAAANRALAELPESSRVIMELRWGRQMSYQDIAEVLGSTPSAVQRQHSRVLMRLRALVQQASQ
jgi:RNA polymerase sigma-70 factor, ECF subfamily